MTRLRWFVIRLMNLYADTCWADLVLWAAFPDNHPWHEIREMRGSAGNCARRAEYPYCGKCEE